MWAKTAKLATKHLKTQVASVIVGSQAIVRNRGIRLVSATNQSIHQLISRPILSSVVLSAAFSSESIDDLASKTPTSGKLSTVVAACGFAKSSRSVRGPSANQPTNRQHANTNGQPILGHVGQGGEDAMFVSKDGLVFGVADGVGGWSGVPGADSAAYSRHLMLYAMEACQSTNANLLKPVDILQFSFDKISREHRIIGSSTACIARFDPAEGMLHYANLGDSGLLLVRSSLLHDVAEENSSTPRKLKTEIPPSPTSHSLIRAKECQHTFNCPYQLGSSSTDRPGDSCQDSLPIYNGDILVVGTDGFWDNLNDYEVLAILRKHAKSPHTFESLNALANQLALEAYDAASSPTRQTPFAQACRQAGKRFAGGKMDDISVICVEFISESANQSTNQPSSDSGSSSPASDSSLSPRGSAAVHPDEGHFRPSKM